MAPGTVRVGTCGWMYADWRSRFYPPGLPTARWRDHYVASFPAVEVDASFYRLPSEAAIEAWRRAAEAAPGFRFALKGSRLITHVRRLEVVDEALATYIGRVRPLGPALAFVLWQLPPTLTLDLPRLERFLDRLPADMRHCVEPRHPSWLEPSVFRALTSRGIACCWVSSAAMPAEAPDTAGFVALRLHGLSGGFAHDYTDAELAPWADGLAAVAASGREAYAFFNNDAEAHAPADARQLIGLLGPAAMPWPPAGVVAPVPPESRRKARR